MKLSQLLIVGSLMVGSAVPVLASSRNYDRHDRDNGGVKVENTAVITSEAEATSKTGMNVINDCGCETQSRRWDKHSRNSRGSDDNLIDTGFAGSQAFSEVADVNKTDLPESQNSRRSRRSSSSADVDVDNYARIYSSADAMSGTGMNMITGNGDNTIMTGDATSLADSYVHDVNLTGFGL